MDNRIPELYLILKRRLSDEEILKAAEVNKEVFNKKLKLKKLNNDQMGISVYFKLNNLLTHNELKELLSVEPFKDASVAFSEAITKGILSMDTKKENYAGLYMYMGTWSNKDHFKNIQTRDLIS